ncbi:MAG TPA: PfkB family carbohydrate kinase [Microvirga sp.]|jgi:sulfofructose kinase|nr:PfkB family carbohydrate kinase [Microvirga sp.]
MTSVLCVGIAVLDYVYAVETMPVRAEKYRARDLAVVGGGIAANAAVAVARLGGRARLATRLGDDPTGAAIVAELEAEGVDCALAHRFAGRRSPTSAILVDGRGERLIVSYSDNAIPAGTSWLPDALPADVGAVLGDTRWVEGSAHLFRLARRAGVPAILDGDRRPDRPDVLELATHIAFSEQGLAEITGVADPAGGLRALAGSTRSWLAVTAGEGGVHFLEDGAVAHEPAFPVETVDTLGAGDTWHGAFALGLAEGMAERAAVRFASAVAAIKCTRFGGRSGTPSRDEVEAFLRERA